MRRGWLEKVDQEAEDAGPAAGQENVPLFALGCVCPEEHVDLLGLPRADKAVPVQASPPEVSWALRLARGKNLGPDDALSRLPPPEAPDAVREAAEVFMLEHAYLEVLSSSVVSQAVSRNPVRSQVVKAVSSGDELVQQAYSHMAAELSWQQGCLLGGSRVVIAQSPDQGPAVAARGSSWSGKDQDGGPVPCLRPWFRLHVDFGGPFKSHYFLVVVDTFSKYVEVLHVATPSAGATIAALLQVFAAQGLSGVIVSDSGPAFASIEYLA
ncbi:uncharacterized protein [Dermacentor albipictus]|uniref:uncharacterized protein n=1 Tax=Dermacentor albipictus TaxID=60249 RepID=UPI0038FC2F6A